ncbi:hypothetical protein ANO11243_040670 [Dothideomycetidae sp. 11243]|nr:hypothetical protein ANO11243_040670 [fungal sp. No.11243]
MSNALLPIRLHCCICLSACLEHQRNWHCTRVDQKHWTPTIDAPFLGLSHIHSRIHLSSAATRPRDLQLDFYAAICTSSSSPARVSMRRAGLDPSPPLTDAPMAVHDSAARASGAASPRHAHSSKAKSPNAVKSRPADPLLMSSMIDSLATIEPVAVVDRSKYYQKPDARHHSRQRSASFGTWPHEDTAALPRPVRPSRRSPNHSPPTSTHVNGDSEPADPPTIRKAPGPPMRLGSYDSGYQESSRSSSLRSRDIEQMQQGIPPVRKTKRRSTHDVSAFGPSRSLEMRSAYDPMALTSHDGRRESAQTPSEYGDVSERQWKADLVPARRSSLHQSERALSRALERRALRKAQSSDSEPLTNLNYEGGDQAALIEEVLTELGEEDSTVKRIRQLKEQKMLRMQSLKAGHGDRPVTPPHVQAQVTRAHSTPANLPTVTDGRVPNGTKANKILGISNGFSETPPETVNSLARLQGPFDSYTESPINKPSLSPESSPERPSSKPGNDYGRALKALHVESKSQAPKPMRDATVSSRSNSIKRSTSVSRQAVAADATARSSVDEEVESYMNSPRLNQTVRHPKTGRVISFSEVGAPHGFPVIVCVGMGLTRFVSAFYDDLALTLGLRLITPDRPGVGNSDPRTERDPEGPMSWHQDVAAICAHLDIGQFSLLAHSAGAIFALATALILPHQVAGTVYLLAPWIPPSQFETPSVVAPENDSGDTSPGPAGALPRSQRLLRVLPVSILKAANSSFLGMNNTSTPSTPKERKPSMQGSRPLKVVTDMSLLTSDTDPDLPLPSSLLSDPQPLALSATSLPTDPDAMYATAHLNAAQHTLSAHETQVSQALVHRIWAASTRNSNPAADLLVCLERHRPVGFRYEDVRKPLVVLHGTDDRRVRLENVKWLVTRVNGVRRAVLPGQGHGLMASAAVMSEVLAEIAADRRDSDACSDGRVGEKGAQTGKG